MKLWPLFILVMLIASTAWASKVKVHHDLQESGQSIVVADGIIKAPPDEVWNYLVRFNDYQFMPRIVDSFFISEEGVKALRESGIKKPKEARTFARSYRIESTRKRGQVWEGFVFMVVNAPFPIENRWYVIKGTQDETQASEHIYRRSWTLMVGNIKKADGQWILKPAENPFQTVGHYEDQVDPGGNVPEWANRMGATQTVPQIFGSLEKIAAPVMIAANDPLGTPQGEIVPKVTSAEEAAKKFYASWKKNDRKEARHVASPSAVKKLFKITSDPADPEWRFVGCLQEGKKMSCSFSFEGGITEMVMKNSSEFQVKDVHFIVD